MIDESTAAHRPDQWAWYMPFARAVRKRRSGSVQPSIDDTTPHDNNTRAACDSTDTPCATAANEQAGLCCRTRCLPFEVAIQSVSLADELSRTPARGAEEDHCLGDWFGNRGHAVQSPNAAWGTRRATANIVFARGLAVRSGSITVMITAQKHGRPHELDHDHEHDHDHDHGPARARAPGWMVARITQR